MAEKDEPLNLKCVGEIVFGPSLPRSARRCRSKRRFRSPMAALLRSRIAKQARSKNSLRLGSVDWSFRIEHGVPQMIVWTRASGRKGSFVGQVIGSDGELLSLTIQSAPVGSLERPFVLFGTASSSVYRGSCP